MLFTAGTLVFNTSAISSYGMPSYRRSTMANLCVLRKTGNRRVNRLLQLGVEHLFAWRRGLFIDELVPDRLSFIGVHGDLL